jgi:hybrid cluster-associated redox disulfide protein
MAPKITKDMTIYDVLQMNPGAAKVFARFGLDCGECLGAASESIEQGTRGHGLDSEEILKALNALFDE